MQFWCLETFRKVVEEMGDSISMSNSTMSRSGMDVATISTLTSIVPLPEALHFKINGHRF